MSDGDKPKRIKFRLPGLVPLLALFATIVLIVILVIVGNRLGFSPLSGLFGSREPVFTVGELNFNVGRDRVFSHVDGLVAAAGSLGIQVLGSDGRETLRDSFRMTIPAITEVSGKFLAFDIGGSAVRVFNETQIISSFDTASDVVSASINQNGWVCIVTQERGSLKSTVTVYNNNGSGIYEVEMRTGIVLSAHLSPDNRNLAILNMTDFGSRITFYHGIDENKDYADALFNFSGGLIIDVKYLSNTELIAISTDSLLTVDYSGSGEELYAFTDKRLGAYTLGSEFIALHLYDYGMGFSGRIVTLGYDGEVLGELGMYREILSMSSSVNYLTVLKSDGLTFFDRNLEEFPSTGDNFYAATRVLALGENAALATSDHSAVVVQRDFD
jgi:hypothetical protein